MPRARFARARLSFCIQFWAQKRIGGFDWGKEKFLIHFEI